jgi:hypothetical protein
VLPQASPTADLGDLRPDEPRGEVHLPMGIDALVLQNVLGRGDLSARHLGHGGPSCHRICLFSVLASSGPTRVGWTAGEHATNV